MTPFVLALAARAQDPFLLAAAHGWLALRARASDERGMSTETVIITAGLAILALTVVAIIASKVTSKANSIPVD